MSITTFSKKGIFHEQNNTENQDAVFSYEDDNICYIALADGATSCRNSKAGAEIACKCIKDFLINSDIFNFSADKLAYLVWEEIMFHIKNEASILNDTEKSFASTFAFTYLDKKSNRLVTYNLGDGAIYILHNTSSEYELLSPPKRTDGVCMLIPNKNAYKSAEINIIENFNGEIFMCSDGLLDLMKKNDVSIEKIKENHDIYTGMDDFSFILLCNY